MRPGPSSLAEQRGVHEGSMQAVSTGSKRGVVGGERVEASAAGVAERALAGAGEVSGGFNRTPVECGGESCRVGEG